MLLADGYIDGHNLICGVHDWDYRYDTGVSEYNSDDVLHKFTAEKLNLQKRSLLCYILRKKSLHS